MFWQADLAVKQEEDFMNIDQSFENIKFEVEDSIGMITINRPDKLNALNIKVLQELRTLLKVLREDKDNQIRGLILTGSGEKAFIAGADIAEMSSMSTEEARDFGHLGQQVTLLFESLSIPVIACVNGFALGGGCEMAMSTDFIYATTNAIFGQPEVKLGLVPGFGGTQRLARYIGRQLARELVFTGRNMPLDEAKEAGLVLRVYETKDQMIEAARKTLSSISKNSPLAVSFSKEVMNAGIDLTIPEGLNLELEKFSSIFSSQDFVEGTNAFIEKRKANFNGK
jgi:enoyl-CoA hydratase